jgi:hypothetical protein
VALNIAPMDKRFTLRLLAIIAALALLAFATIALAHGHLSGKSQQDAHCAMCMAIHSGHHALFSSTAVLQFAPVWWAFLLGSLQVTILAHQFFPTNDRAPPSI